MRTIGQDPTEAELQDIINEHKQNSKKVRMLHTCAGEAHTARHHHYHHHHNNNKNDDDDDDNDNDDDNHHHHACGPGAHLH